MEPHRMTTTPNPTPESSPEPRKVALDPQLEAIVASLNDASRIAGEGRVPDALARIAEAEQALSALPEALATIPPAIALRAATHEGRGQIALRTGDMALAFTHLSEAELQRQREVALGGMPAPLARAVSNLNLASAAQRLGHLAEGLVANARCLDLLSGLPVDASSAVFGVAALEGRATLLAQLGQMGPAVESFGAARGRALWLLQKGHPQARVLLAEILVNASRVHFQDKRLEPAMAHAVEAAEVAFAALEASQFKDSQSGSLYVAAELNQVAFAEALGSFSRGEDALFRVLKLIGPNPQVVERGLAFYERLLARADDELEAGGLPRDECEESLARLRAMGQPAAQTPAS
jgi:hypothetical protein